MEEVSIGILALQGAFAEHQSALNRLNPSRKLNVILVRTPDDLCQCDALIIPGGESTTIALLARLAGLFEPLKEFMKVKPIWGTCAGAILLSQAVVGAKKGGQELLGGISTKIARNGWGSQVESFEVPLELNGLEESTRSFQAFFIRAPVVLEMFPPDESPITVVARIPLDVLPPSLVDENMHEDDPRTVVALRQGRHLLTTFHPELTEDDRFHRYFVEKCVLIQ
ncbi:glutamine amidotransferase subunit pdxT [Lentinula raphanica]|uniref:glutaminase n=1 Tax=Lentinula raphanica TaxID=153919 RepID=A0AA38PH12_9AGAR|nr:PdxT/SNO family [Lentinula raphanica]KAJ3823963.1 glutamine amidotransferase subunit pdxT [Lentinula raphanica]KAJ3842749.1 glutamine amidotransferase subunit pdxT [Lentinula raphanica]KAJ3972345.1 glutamine amidotransferase subunit pdxT [Lentinula raphanica]